MLKHEVVNEIIEVGGGRVDDKTTSATVDKAELVINDPFYMAKQFELLVKIHPDCPNENPINSPAKKGDCGYDLSAWVDTPTGELVVPPQSFVNVKTGVQFLLPDGYWGDIRPRSSTFAKRKLLVMGGTIDQGYTGQISIFIFNCLHEEHSIMNGDRLAQLVICPMAIPPMKLVDELPKTERANSGFGSTGRN